MPEVIDIRPAGDGRHDDDEVLDDERPAPGRRVAVAAVAAVVVVFAVAYLVLGRGGHGQLGPGGAAGTKAAKAQVVTVASDALEAWGRFSVSGRLDDVAPYFDPDGPQFAQFRKEAPDITARPAGPPEYRFAMSEAAAERKGNDWIVRGPVVVSRPSEADQRFRWELVMRQKGETWRVWTVRDLAAGPASTVGGTP